MAWLHLRLRLSHRELRAAVEGLPPRRKSSSLSLERRATEEIGGGYLAQPRSSQGSDGHGAVEVVGTRRGEQAAAGGWGALFSQPAPAPPVADGAGEYVRVTDQRAVRPGLYAVTPALRVPEGTPSPALLESGQGRNAVRELRRGGSLGSSIESAAEPPLGRKPSGVRMGQRLMGFRLSAPADDAEDAAAPVGAVAEGGEAYADDVAFGPNASPSPRPSAEAGGFYSVIATRPAADPGSAAPNLYFEDAQLVPVSEGPADGGGTRGAAQAKPPKTRVAEL